MILEGWKMGRENEIFNYVVRREKRRDFNRFFQGPLKHNLSKMKRKLERKRCFKLNYLVVLVKFH